MDREKVYDASLAWITTRCFDGISNLCLLYCKRGFLLADICTVDRYKGEENSL